MNKLSVSVIAPCRNEAKHVRAFLDALLRQQTDDMEWEAIIADGLSDDGTREILEEYARREPRLRIIDNTGQIVSTGLNAAIRAAGGQIIVRMDVHTEYAPDYIRRSVEELLRTGADNVGGPPRVKADSFRMRVFGAAFHSPFAVGGARWHDTTYEGYVDSVAYGCWRKETLLRLGLFDETLVRNQDDELNLRIARSGGKVWQSPAIMSWYNPRATLSNLFRQHLQYGFWKIAVMGKYGRPASWRHLAPGAFVLFHFIMLAVVILAAISGSSVLALVSARVWAAGAGVYVLACVAAALSSASRFGWAVLPALPLVFSVYHVSYGTGLLAGLFYRYLRGPQSPPPVKLFTEITR